MTDEVKALTADERRALKSEIDAHLVAYKVSGKPDIIHSLLRFASDELGLGFQGAEAEMRPALARGANLADEEPNV